MAMPALSKRDWAFLNKSLKLRFKELMAVVIAALILSILSSVTLRYTVSEISTRNRAINAKIKRKQIRTDNPLAQACVFR